MHSRLLLIALAFPVGAAFAQTPLVQESQPLDPRTNQKVQRIHQEDSSAVIDEVRYGGQTRSVTVKPKNGLPEYEIQPADAGRTGTADSREGLSSGNGRRVWNVFSF